MIGRTMSPLRKHLFRRGQTGQALAILAIGFIALCAFVGIVTDVSLLFVRYSTLRRAVDSAAVAAAGQMRRDPNQPTEADEQAASIAHLNLAARQFIEVYGLNPSQVLVETCQAQQLPFRTVTIGAYTQVRPLDTSSQELYLYSPNPPYAKTGDNPAANPEDRRRYEQLCKDNELKLVRVTAQIEAPTVFLRLLGFPSITLEESSISQTAVLDVVLILDVSESMAYETTYEDWEERGYYYRYVPPYMDLNDYPAWGNVINRSMNQIMDVNNRPPVTGATYPWFGIVSGSAPAVVRDPVTGATYTGPTVEYLPPGSPPGALRPSEMCRVRPAPFATAFFSSSTKRIPQYLYEEYVNLFGADWVRERFRGNTWFDGFFPQYDSYACCNDPNGDYLFDDLVCQPFQDVRTATGLFLERLDFLRGDRVAFVTFDHTAHIIDPDGAGGQRSMIETQHDYNPDGGPIDFTLNDRYGAETILNNVIGVRAEPSFYADDYNNATMSGAPDGLWDGLINWNPDRYDPNNGDFGWEGRPYEYFQTAVFNDIYIQPVKSSCWLDIPAMNEPQVGLHLHNRALGSVYWSLLTDAASTPDWFWDQDWANDPAYFTDSAYAAAVNDLYYVNWPTIRNAEYRGACGGGNIGSALGQAQHALIQDGRTEGAIWLMVLLSDGASGASDPVMRDIDYDANPDVYYSTYPEIFNQDTPTTYDPIGGDYGAFGVCPYGTQENPGELTLDDEFPFCSDKDPSTRHFCSAMPMPPTHFELDTDCDKWFYDTDDYARDWADWVTLADITTDERSPIQRSSNEQLPTIFAIGIGLDFSAFNPATGVRVCEDADWACRTSQPWTYEDYLGEQLLRYIADVGDNYQLDDDYWQCVMGNRIPNSVLDAGTCENKVLDNWGARGPCEIQDVAPIERGNWTPLDPMQSCGNYFAAGTQSELENVFGVIASRMFTRLSQ